MFGKGMYLSIFYCLCYEMDIYTDTSKEHVLEERDPDLNEDEDIIMDDSREEHCRDVYGEDKKNFRALRWKF